MNFEQAVATVEAEYGKEATVCMLGHSIGGWVLRSYIGEVLGEERALRQVSSLITLGTPHQPPPSSSPLARIDQTRGLLSDINTRFPAGSPLPAERVTCVAGTGTRVAATLPALLRSRLWDPASRRSPLLEQVRAPGPQLQAQSPRGM
jgi:hypothetical protein